MSERAKTSGEIRKLYFENVIEPEPEDVHERMKGSFDSGVVAGMYAALEWGYAHLDEYKNETLDMLSKNKQRMEGGEESDSNET